MRITRRSLFKSAAVIAAAPTGLMAESSVLPTRKIPSSGAAIPVVGIGTNRYGVGDDVEKLLPLRETLAKYAELGGGLIDTAPSYRNSETVLGRLIAELELGDQFFMATKCDEKGGNATRAQVASSEQKLQSGTLDLVAIHNLRSWQEQLSVLRELQQDQKINHIGITTSRHSQFEALADILKNEPLDFVQLNYSIADRMAEEQLLKLASDKGVAVMINLPFGHGRLFKAVKGKTLPKWTAEHGISSWAQYFLKFVISHPAVTCVIPGTTKVRHLVDNLGASYGPMPDAKQRQVMLSAFESL
ncbi:MAG: aldo/keto reductase [Pseudomonadota bacterium]